MTHTEKVELRSFLERLEAIQKTRDIIRKAGANHSDYSHLEKSSLAELDDLLIHLQKINQLNGSRLKNALVLLEQSAIDFLQNIDQIMKAQELADWMQQKGIKQHELARKIGVSKATVNKWCSGK